MPKPLKLTSTRSGILRQSVAIACFVLGLGFINGGLCMAQTLELVPSTDTMLRQKAAPVGIIDGKTREKFEAMKESSFIKEGLGLAAPQIGILLQAIALNPKTIVHIAFSLFLRDSPNETSIPRFIAFSDRSDKSQELSRISRQEYEAFFRDGDWRHLGISSEQADALSFVINPEISINVSTTGVLEETYECCFSLPDLLVKIGRSTDITVTWNSFSGGHLGKRYTARFTGFAAIPPQHESDHLNGLLTIDHIYPGELEEIKKKLVNVSVLKPIPQREIPSSATQDVIAKLKASLKSQTFDISTASQKRLLLDDIDIFAKIDSEQQIAVFNFQRIYEIVKARSGDKLSDRLMDVHGADISIDEGYDETVMINPKVSHTKESETEKGYECFRVLPRVAFEVNRFSEIVVDFFDPSGTMRHMITSGLYAKVIQRIVDDITYGESSIARGIPQETKTAICTLNK